MTEMNWVTAILIGVSLAACAGLRAFMPLFAMGLAVRYHVLPVQPWLGWAGSDEAVITFGIATFLELLADKIPVVDHALDSVYTVIRPVAGALVAMGALHQVSPAHSVALGIIIGAPIAAGLHLTKAGTRLASTTMTAGAGNPVLSVFEDLIAVVGAALAVLAPAVAVLLLGLLLFAGYRWLRSRRRRMEWEAAPAVVRVRRQRGF